MVCRFVYMFLQLFVQSETRKRLRDQSQGQEEEEEERRHVRLSSIPHLLPSVPHAPVEAVVTDRAPPLPPIITSPSTQDTGANRGPIVSLSTCTALHTAANRCFACETVLICDDCGVHCCANVVAPCDAYVCTQCSQDAQVARRFACADQHCTVRATHDAYVPCKDDNSKGYFEGFCDACTYTCDFCDKRLCCWSRKALRDDLWIDYCLCIDGADCKMQGCKACFVDCGACGRLVSLRCATKAPSGSFVCRRPHCFQAHNVADSDDEEGAATV
jgi:hypothetical protein